MANTKDIKKIFNKIIKKKQINIIHKELNVLKIWRVIFITFIMVIIFIIGISVYIFFRINNGEIFLAENDENVQIETINRVLLEETIEAFEMKKLEFERLKNNKPNIKNPL